MIFDGFVGGSYESISIAWDAQRALNLYVESDESGKGKSNLALIGTPGLSVFDTLPTTPVRGMWSGLADNLPGSTATDLMFAVSGSKLYQLFSGGTHSSALGDVGDDAAHSPVTINVNGGQILITSAGLAWIYNGSTVVQVFFNDGKGTVSTSGTAVTWLAGDQFNSGLVNSLILIAGVSYVITAFVDLTHVTLGASAGTQVAAYTVEAGVATVSTSGTAVTLLPTATPGTPFTGIPAGSGFVIGSTLYAVASVTDATHLTLAGSAGTQASAIASYRSPVLAAMATFIDTYFAILPPDSKVWFLSAPNDGTTDSPLDFAVKEGFPDNIASILADHEELWLFGSESTEPWQDTGAATFPFQRNPGTVIRMGCRAPFTPVSINQGVAWIGGDERGNPIAQFATGFQPQRVSTHAVETQWASYSTITDATAFVHILRGHQFWVINFPSGNATWVWDATAGLWHERGWWNGASIDRHRGGTHAYAWGKHFLGDWSNGKIYWFDESLFDDAGTPIHRIRTAPHISDEEEYTFYARLRIAMQAGPNPLLSWADDSGLTYSTPIPGSARLIGVGLQMSAFRRLGKGKDRVFSMLITDAVAVVITNAYLDVEAGNA